MTVLPRDMSGATDVLGGAGSDVVVAMEVVIPLVTMTANTDVNDVTGAMVMDEESVTHAMAMVWWCVKHVLDIET